MRSLVRTSLGLLGLALIAPSGAIAQDATSSAPAGYLPASSVTASAPAPAGLDGQPLPAAPVAAPQPQPHQHQHQHQHNGKPVDMPMGQIVRCEHLPNGVCPACQAALNMPGQFVAMPSATTGPNPMPPASPSPASAASASPMPSPSATFSAYKPLAKPLANPPGRAVASSGPNPSTNLARPSRKGSTAAIGDPMPVGVVQANFAPAAPVGMSAAYAPQQANAPGRAVAESGAGHEPYQLKSGGFPHPRIIGHLLGLTGIGSERAEEKARLKAEKHAMISYDNNGTAPVEDVPASVVYGKKR